MNELEHECPRCHKVYPCPDPPDRRGCYGDRSMLCSDRGQGISDEHAAGSETSKPAA